MSDSPRRTPPMRATLALAAALLSLLLSLELLMPPNSWGADSPVKDDEVVQLFPTSAAWEAQRREWIVPLHVWIYEPERDDRLRRRALEELRRSVDLVVNDAEWETFESRGWPFLADNERGKRLTVAVEGASITLPATGPAGHADGELRLPGTGDDLLPTGPVSLRRVEAVLIARDGRRFIGRVDLVPPQGLSVVSDIDDTIKVTAVRDRGELLRNTFTRPFTAVDGMAERYQRWAGAGAALHYVSNSPWQLAAPLTEFLDRESFPPGSLHLRLLRLKDRTFLDFLREGSAAKQATILSLLDRWPGRKFILVGDSGEQDPEVYGEIALARPRQVVQILIRNTTNETAQSPRYAQAFRELPPDRWQVFDDPSQVRDSWNDAPVTPRDD